MDTEKVEEKPNTEASIDTNNIQKETKPVETQVQKQPVQVPTNTQPTQTQAAINQAQNEIPTPISNEELLKGALNKIEEQGRIIEFLKGKDLQRETEKRREIVASYVNKVFEHEDKKKAEEQISKYLEGGYQKLSDVELIDVLKDRFGEQMIEVQAKSTKKLARAGIEDFVTNNANLTGNSEGKTNKGASILKEFSSLVEDRRTGVI